MSGRKLACIVRVLIVVMLWLSSTATPSAALPYYAQRSGRTCANCHVSPTIEDSEGWDNPKLAKRKCNLSCVSCHVNPTGGGLRNASGRYYAQSTLAALPTQERGYDDLGRELFSAERVWRFRQKHDKVAAIFAEGGRIVPSDRAEVDAGIGSGQTGRWTAFGKPLGPTTEMSYWDGRYDDLNADPMVQIGGDFRAAFWSGTRSVFPMQADVHASIQPVQHITAMATVAARGRSSGPMDALSDSRGPVFARNAFVMVHELPYQSWAKAGVFLPSFGMYLDDHTAFTREWFEMDVSDSQDTVLGVEVGTAPNYPFATVSVFKNDAFGVDRDPGWGASATGGYRGLGWSANGHMMIKQRNKQGRGDLIAGGVTWAYNPAAYHKDLPLTLLGEVSVGRRTTELGRDVVIASTAEGWLIVRNGLTVRARVDAGVQQAGTGPLQSRVQAGVDLTPVPGVTFTALGRGTIRAGEDGFRPGVLLMTHLSF